MRHAHAKMGEGINDFDRELSQTGIDEANFIGDELNAKKVVVDKIISSSAKRAKKTAELIVEKCSNSKTLDLKDYLYLAEIDVLFEEIQNLPEQCKTVLLVAHNPGISELAISLLSGLGNIYMPTATIISIGIKKKSWKKLIPKKNKLIFSVSPEIS
jgi:phosphohistidine phosphatase